MKRTVNVSERVRKVSMEGECATVCVLHTAASAPCRAQQIHAALVSRQSFPHLWKTLWKIAQMNVWEQILARIETKLNRHAFYTWFRPTSFIAEDFFFKVVGDPKAVLFFLHTDLD